MQPRYTFTAFCQVMFLVIIVLQSPGQALASYPNAINDDSDQFQYVVSAPGLPGWRISEPFISLWLHDALIRYQTSHGRTVAFDLSYKQRDSRPASSVFGFGRYWECSWLSAIAYNYEPPQKLGDIGKVDGIFPYASLGGVRVYTLDDTTVEYSSKSTLLDQWGVNHEAQNFLGFRVSYQDGRLEYYRYLPFGGGGGIAYLSQMVDATSRTNFLYYTLTNNIVLLTSMVDVDGKTNTFRYDTTFTNLITEIVDAYGRTNTFSYDSNGRLTNIVNPEKMSCSFVYDAQNVITNYISPYGTNIFKYTTNANSGSVVTRSMEVTEPDGRKHLWMYRDQCTKLNESSSTDFLPFSYAANEVPSTTPLGNTFDNTWMDARNTFYWSPLCYSKLSASYLQTGAFTNLSLADYKLARLSHWLREYNNVATVCDTLSMQRQASPDGTVEGQKFWYDYWGKISILGTNYNGQNVTNYYSRGTNSNPECAALLLPDGSTRFAYAEFNQWLNPTKTVGTYSGPSGVLTRTNSLLYAANGIDLTSMRGPSGELISSNIYNGYHQVLTNYNAVNETTVFTYNSNHQLASVKTAAGLTTTNIFFISGTYKDFLDTTIDVEISRTNSFSYTNGLLYTYTDGRGLTTTNTWDKLQRLTIARHFNGAISYTYTNLDLIEIVDKMGFGHRSGYNSFGQTVWSADPLNQTNYYGYYAWGGFLGTTNALGQSTSLVYDNLGRTIATIFADGTALTNDYNLLGQLVRTADAVGVGVTNSYNNQGLICAVSNAFDRLSLTLYDARDRATNSIDVNGVTNVLTYDDLGRALISTYTANGAENRFAYNVYGLVAWTNQLTNATTYGYDSAKRQIAETNANNEVMRYSYDASGALTNLVDGKGQGTTWHFDLFGRVLDKVDHTGMTNIVYGYDPNNRVTNRWTPGKLTTKYAYSAVGNLTSVDYPNSPDVSFKYDALNRLTNMVDAVGTNVYQYTSFGSLLSEDGPWENDTISYVYYKANHLIGGLSLQRPNASAITQTYNYDSANRLQTLIAPEGTYSYAYQTPGSLIQKVSFPNGAYITNSFDNLARLKGTFLKDSSNNTLNSHEYAYDLASQVTNHCRTEGSYVVYDYDKIGQLKVASGKEPGGTTNRLHEQLGYSYDAAANLSYRTNNALVQTFGVNTLNQLGSASRSGTLTVAGTTTGSATNVTVNSSNAVLYADRTFAKDAFTPAEGTNSFTAVGRDNYGRVDTNAINAYLPAAVAFSYDANGNLASDGTRAFDYDDENQLIRVTVTNCWKSEFVYDGARRRRVRKEYGWLNSVWVQTNEVRYVHDGNLVIQERDANNLPRVSYTRGLDFSGDWEAAGGIGGLLARLDCASQQAAYYHCDASGNVNAMISPNQVLVAKYLYDPYGNILSTSGTLAEANSYRFSSKEMHANSQLIYFGIRFYDPNVQRWIARDPSEEDGGINLYGYAANNPASFGDAFGLGPIQYKPIDFNSLDPFGARDVTLVVRDGNLYSVTVDSSGSGIRPDGVIRIQRTYIYTLVGSASQFLGQIIGPGGQFYGSRNSGSANGSFWNRPLHPAALRILEWIVPGQASWDRAMGAFWNGQTLEGFGHLSSYVGEVALTLAGGLLAKTPGVAAVTPRVAVPAAKKAGSLTYDELRQAGVNLTDRMSGNQFRKLVESIKHNGLQNKVINFAKIGGENYIVLGNNRLQAARKLGITDQLIFIEVQLPFRGFKTENEVINAAAEVLGGH